MTDRSYYRKQSKDLILDQLFQERARGDSANRLLRSFGYTETRESNFHPINEAHYRWIAPDAQPETIQPAGNGHTLDLGHLDQLKRDLAAAEKALVDAGFEKTPVRVAINGDQRIDAIWLPIAPNPGSNYGRPPVNEIYWTKADHEAGTAAARTETLRTVLEALQISGYTRRDILREEIRRLSAAHNNGEAVSVRDRDTGPSYDTDSFWADLQTALDVRAERKAADERAATEKKVAGLRGSDSLILRGLDLADGLAKVLIKIPSPPVSADEMGDIAKIGESLGVEGDLEAFAETAAKLADDAGPAPTKKSAKKKQETTK